MAHRNIYWVIKTDSGTKYLTYAGELITDLTESTPILIRLESTYE